MLAILTGDAEATRPPVPPHVALDRLRSFQEQYALWLLGPSPHAPGDIVTIRREAPIRGHGDLFMVVEVDRRRVHEVPDQTSPPPRSRKTGLREDLRLAFIGDATDSVRNFWLEGWMVEPWSAEQSEQHQILQRADTGRAQ